MFAELLPVLAFVGGILLIPFFALRAARKREKNCGANPKQCFWCGKDCHYYRLDKS